MRVLIQINRDVISVADLVKKYIAEIKNREEKLYCRNFLKGIPEIKILKITMSMIVETIRPFSNANVLINTKSKNDIRDKRCLRKKNKAIIILIGK